MSSNISTIQTQDITVYDQILQLIVSLNSTFFYISIFINLSSLFTYILEIVTILKHKQFHTPFYWLFITRAVAVSFIVIRQVLLLCYVREFYEIMFEL